MAKPNYRDMPCRYFLKPGGRNTKALVESVVERAKALQIRKILVATCSGRTALAVREAIAGEVQIIAVTHVTGFVRPNHQELDLATRQALETKGITVLTCQHAFGGVGRGVRKKLATYQVDEIMAHTLRIFGQGTKVAIEVSLMAADAGLVRTDEDIIAMGGTEAGADSALVIRPANSASLFDLRVREVIGKPSQF
jgi:hypothetical protein